MISLLYEFVLAQLITIFFGSTFIIYAITIGIYTFSLGLGALFYDSIKNSTKDHALLFRVEIALALSALMAPFFIILLSSNDFKSYLGMASFLMAFVPVFLCGFLSGVELPCLLSICGQGSEEEVVFVDFLGMFAGAILFAVFLVDYFGPVKLTWLLSFLNIMVIVLYLIVSKIKMQKRLVVSYAACSFALLALILSEHKFIDLFRGVHGV